MLDVCIYIYIYIYRGDTDQPIMIKDLLDVSIGTITKSKAKKLNEVLYRLA